MSFGGVNQVSPQTPQIQVPQPAAQPQQARPVQAQPKVDAKQFNQMQNQVKLPTTNVNALTQLPSQDQQQLMKLAQDNGMNRFVANMTNAQKQIQADVPPRSLLGAGQSIPPAAMRAMAAAMGKVFSGREFEIEVDREYGYMSFKIGGKSFNVSVKTPLKKGVKYNPEEEDEEEDIEESL
ncbi:hypothetical protein COW36_22270 [bacterium (Candidatus Blackallbacteria) CG17_big_fil_post_rev_8_21_14_2_50_48_46]|uniref:Uncharacterized protein n=1 Tax=bacterium (Candidatus Blackallbacteria) CG17_big_fil_post_rev_8_21_14_2_50_48_46 TaxID=2014261 RepID=A0A2M7FYF8_9BACT|nr:MAG: hypothetical protein COW64_13700 [bacterium (Candidatus Blackallbacteria) CG18_big_fil_WC_8_21_14_2_50_49_26]PIW14341.1 MAG: hypothetical protein COW36_22270 [bacterium (Candidatus Blackallbacteria) CG17_big_fil_post_rev_8_21_14_2_50_48_46]PIW45610.1 MAG: hypothetical protein COW20_19875 [bacterium (Candidatus Blackallbacteria) CG13_big_fil_rev_8_21_14_2_50_49_14]